MTAREQLLKEIEQVSDTVLEEVLSFLRLAQAKHEAELPVEKTMQRDDRPIWEVADQIIAQIPAEAFKELPTDGAAEIDHYLYGALK